MIPEAQGYVVKRDGRVFTKGKVTCCKNRWGQVTSRKYRDRELRQQPAANGYMVVYLRQNGKNLRRYVHRLVATEFIDNPEGKPEVNHKDGDKTNNRVCNLEWVTREENIQHAEEHGLFVRDERGVYV